MLKVAQTYPVIVGFVGLLLLLVGCDGTEPETGCDDGTGRPAYERVGAYFYADWGPDGRLAVLHTPMQDSTYLNAQSGLYTLRADGSDKRKVLLDAEIGASIRLPVWSPDGQWIAFAGGGQIYKVSAEGDSLVQLTTGPHAKGYAAWSPDGRWVAYEQGTGPDAERGLWVVRSDGSVQRPLRKPSAEEMCISCPTSNRWYAGSPTWSPRGDKIAYVAFENYFGEKHLAVYDTATAEVDFIYKAPTTIYYPRFSPDGTEILFQTAVYPGDQGGIRIGLLNRDGSGLHWPAAGADGGQHPTWSPDGEHIVYRRLTWSCTYQNPGYGDLWVMRADGSGKRQITFSNGKAE